MSKENGTSPPAGKEQNQQNPAVKRRHAGGMPKGKVTRKTLDKLMAREEARKQITASLGPILRAQIAHAIGIGHLYTRDKNGKFTKIESLSQIDQLLTHGTEGEHYWIFAKDPSTAAATDLLNRALDKPKEQEQEIKLTGSVDVVSILRKRHERSQRG